jgi:hypothetical protein
MPNKYEIKIVTTADPSGAQSVSKELDNVSKAAKPAAEAIKSTGDESEKTAQKKSKLLDATKKLTHAMPELGVVVSALKNPFTILAFVAAAAANAIAGYRQKVEEAAQAMQNFNSGNLTIRSFFELIAKHRADSKAFADSLKEIGDRAQTAGEKLGAMNATIERRWAARRNLGELNKQAELNQVGADEAAGRLTPQQAVARRTAIELRYAEATRHAAEREQQEKLDATRAAAAASKTESGKAVDQQGAAEEAFLIARQQNKQVSAFVGVSLRDVQRRRERINRLQANPPEELVESTGLNFRGLGVPAADYRDAKNATKIQGELQAEESRLQELQTSSDERLAAAQKKRDAAAARATTAAETARGLGFSAAEQQQALDDTRALNRGVLEPAERRAIVSQGVNQLSGELKRVNEEQARAVMEASRSMDRLGVVLTQLTQATARMNAQRAEVEKEIRDLKAREMKNTLKP